MGKLTDSSKKEGDEYPASESHHVYKVRASGQTKESHECVSRYHIWSVLVEFNDHGAVDDWTKWPVASFVLIHVAHIGDAVGLHRTKTKWEEIFAR